MAVWCSGVLVQNTGATFRFVIMKTELSNACPLLIEKDNRESFWLIPFAIWKLFLES